MQDERGISLGRYGPGYCFAHPNPLANSKLNGDDNLTEFWGTVMAEERPIWGIHMDQGFGTRPVEEGFVRTGWPAVGDLSKLSPDREAFKKAVAKVYPTTKPGAVP